MTRTAALLLLALAAACALPAASARDLTGLSGSLEASAPAGGSAPEAAPVAPKGFIEDVLEYVETAVEVGADFVAGLWGGEVCLWGSNCGMNCEHDSYDESDPLDTACYFHDRCLADAGSDEEAKCSCDDALITTADEIANYDEDSDMVRTAATVRDGIAALGKSMHGCYW